jgi:ribosome recycling factor
MSYTLIDGKKVLEHFIQKLAQIRTGRVNTSILDHVVVEAYESKLSIIEVATISVPEPSQLMITPFDKSLLRNIEKALTDQNVGANPNNDGIGIRLVFPPLTQETRKEKTKEVFRDMEDAKIMVRNMRQDILKTKKRQHENDEISDDELKRFETDLQKEVDTLNKELEATAKTKEQELLTM